MAATCRKLNIRPTVSKEEALQLAHELYGLQKSKYVTIKELSSYDDRNFYIRGQLGNSEEKGEYVLKIMNTRDSYNEQRLDGTDEVLFLINRSSCGVQCPLPVPMLNGTLRHKINLQIHNPFSTFSPFFPSNNLTDVNSLKSAVSSHPIVTVQKYEDGSLNFFMEHYVRMLSFVPGQSIDQIKDPSDEVFWQCGLLVAKIQHVLKDFHHQGLQPEDSIWDLKNTPALQDPYLKLLKDETRHAMVQRTIEEFSEIELKSLRQQIIHSDMNEGNILFTTRGSDALVREPIAMGLIDFGDITFSCRVFELAICMAYMSIHVPNNPLRAAKLVLQGYETEAELDREEEKALPTLMKARIAQSLTIGNYQYATTDPDNSYLLNTSKRGWSVLQYYSSMSAESMLKLLRSNNTIIQETI